MPPLPSLEASLCAVAPAPESPPRPRTGNGSRGMGAEHSRPRTGSGGGSSGTPRQHVGGMGISAPSVIRSPTAKASETTPLASVEEGGIADPAFVLPSAAVEQETPQYFKQDRQKRDRMRGQEILTPRTRAEPDAPPGPPATDASSATPSAPSEPAPPPVMSGIEKRGIAAKAKALAAGMTRPGTAAGCGDMVRPGTAAGGERPGTAANSNQLDGGNELGGRSKGAGGGVDRLSLTSGRGSSSTSVGLASMDEDSRVALPSEFASLFGQGEDESAKDVDETSESAQERSQAHFDDAGKVLHGGIQTLKTLFRHLDDEAAGKITKSQWVDFFGRRPSWRRIILKDDDDSSTLAKSVDIEIDARLQRRLLRQLKEVDLNKDGFIDEREFLTFFQRLGKVDLC